MNVYEVSNNGGEKLQLRMSGQRLVVTMNNGEQSLQIRFNLTEAHQLALTLHNMGFGVETISDRL